MRPRLPRSFSCGVLCALALLGCDSEAESAAVCEGAQDVVIECGHEPIASLDACDAEAQAAATDLQAAYDAAGCAGLEGSGKDDSFFCRLAPWLCSDPLEPLWPAPGPATTRFPILLAHGFNTSTTNFWRFNEVDSLLRDHGHGDGHVALGSVPPFDSVEVRAEFLAGNVADLLAESGAEKVNLLCFSMGGLDCRALVSPAHEYTCADSDDDGELDVPCGDVVASIVTISAHNHGSGMADVATGVPGGSTTKAIDFVATLWGKTFSEVADDGHLIGALLSMTEARFEGLHDDDADHVYPKNPNVYYQSWAGFSHVGGLPNPISSDEDACTVEVGEGDPSLFSDQRECDRDGRCTELRMYRHDDERDKMDALLVGGAAFVAHGLEAIPNDGVSTVKSSIFGEFMGCYPADHLDQVGQVKDKGTDEDTGFNFQRLYLRIGEDLATERMRQFVGPVDPATGRHTKVFERASF